MPDSLSQLRQVLGDDRYHAGKGLVKSGRVSETRILQAGMVITGMVSDNKTTGDKPAIWRVFIQLQNETPLLPSHVNGECNCNRGENCVHIAAVLIAVKGLDSDTSQDPQASANQAINNLTHITQIPTPLNSEAPGSKALLNSARQQLYYVIDVQPDVSACFAQACQLQLSVWVGRRKNAAQGQNSEFCEPHLFIPQTTNCALLPRYVNEQDRHILRPLLSQMIRGPWVLQGEAGSVVLQRIAATQRLFYQSLSGTPLQSGGSVAGNLRWTVLSNGDQQLRCCADITSGGTSAVNLDFINLDLDPPVYIDTQNRQWGELTFPYSPWFLCQCWGRGVIAAEEVSAVNQQLKAQISAEHFPPLIQLHIDSVSSPTLTCKLRLWSDKNIAYISLYFVYNGIAFNSHSLSKQQSTLKYLNGHTVHHIARNFDTEQQLQAQFRCVISTAANSGKEVGKPVRCHKNRQQLGVALPTPRLWLNFMVQILPSLQADGWEVEIDPLFPYRLTSSDQWYGQVHKDGVRGAEKMQKPLPTSSQQSATTDWFNLEMGIVINGLRVNLLPALAAYLQTQCDGEKPIAGLTQDKADGVNAAKNNSIVIGKQLLVKLPDGRYLAVGMGRIKQISQTLVELFDQDCLNDTQGLSLPANQISRLTLLSNELTGSEKTAGKYPCFWSGDEALQRLAEDLQNFSGIEPLQPPPQFQTQLRPYQQEGLGWLQFLRRYRFGGILADDMGLGKTVQALAHLAMEKQQGRARGPSLIIAPTSLIGNWQQEVQRFAPQLTALVLHGHKRRQKFSQIDKVDLVISTYPLLNVDAEQLLSQQFYLLILDEAQTIKNPRSKVSQTTRLLQAEHRLCLTGTPMENHLGELWSLFDFIQPGFLGDAKQFQRLYRTPIEKNASQQRAQALAKRISPFVLRRTKATVAKELPPKTEMLEYIVFDEKQQDFYDSIRLSMHRQIRDILQRQGLARSHIAVLDALLKLRQACCDPRLVKIEPEKLLQQPAKESTETIPSAKLQWLLTMLPELVEQGRRILLFSQFTSMLSLIEEAVNQLQIPYLKLTGQTRDRTRMVERFQAGTVPLFLISLKAGGTGLNLTMADTVIHYDPWWNPASENQATDRAHRIGQDKPIFVYKLITQGSVEEKILQLQANKQDLANGLYAGNSGTPTRLTAEDLEILFEPA